ncbi:MAG: hypothetical protein WDO71_28075 [Bacteroidota bacterium]
MPADCKEEKITIKAVYKSDPALWRETTIWIKKLPDPELLPLKNDIINDKSQRKRRNR